MGNGVQKVFILYNLTCQDQIGSGKINYSSFEFQGYTVNPQYNELFVKKGQFIISDHSLLHKSL